MNVEVRDFGARRPKIFIVDGEPLLLREAAAKVGLPETAFEKRIERGVDLTLAYERHSPQRRP